MIYCLVGSLQLLILKGQLLAAAPAPFLSNLFILAED